MKKKNSVRLVTMLMLLTLLLVIATGCGSSDRSKQVIVFNYGQYIEPTILEQFKQETGYEVLYEEFTTNEDMYSKFAANTASYDVICCSDYMASKMLQEGSLQKIDYDKMQYIDNIGQQYWDFSKSFDPTNEYSIPYFWGTLGILYDKTVVDPKEAKSWSVLWDEKYADQIIMSNSMRDSFLPALKLKGYSANTSSEAELTEAQQMLIEQKPLVQAYLVDEARDEMIAGNAAMAVVFSSEAFIAMDYNDKLDYCVPDEGSNFWVDSWVVPNTCENMDGALAFLDFMLREDVAMTNFETVWTATPNQALFNALDEETKNNEALFPTQDALSRCEIYLNPDDATFDLYSKLWKEIKAS